MQTLSRWLSPKSLVYLLIHLILFMIGLLLVRRPEVVAIGIGTSLMAAGIVGWAVFVHVKLSERRLDQLEVFTLFGLINVFEARAVRIKPEYDSRLANARAQIDILGFGLKAFREDYRDQFARWSQKARVRVLLIDPKFPHSKHSYAAQRSAEEKMPANAIESDVQEFLEEINKLLPPPRSTNFEIRLYTCLPSINIFRIDDELFWGPYLIGEPSRNAPTFLVHRGGLLFDRLANHFESIWKEYSWLPDTQKAG